MGLPTTSTKIGCFVTSAIEPGVEVIMIPGRVDHLFFCQFVDGHLELALSEVDLFLCRVCLSVGGDS